MSGRPGFPVDDEVSIHCHDGGGNVDLSVFYNHQFMQNEVVADDPGQTLVSVHKLSRANVLPGTLYGVISATTWELEFAARWNSFSLRANDLIFHDPKVSGTVDWKKGEITLRFKSPPGRHGLIVSYEFSTESECVSGGPGFPVDDEVSIQCGDGGSAYLSIFYTHQFMQNEVVADDPGQTLVSVHKLSKANVLPGTLCGTLLVSGRWALDFTTVLNSPDDLVFQDPGYPLPCVPPKVSGTVDWKKGEITLRFKSQPGKHGLKVSYDFPIEPVKDECICTTATLMAQGCRCGHLKKHA